MSILVAVVVTALFVKIMMAEMRKKIYSFFTSKLFVKIENARVIAVGAAVVAVAVEAVVVWADNPMVGKQGH